VVVVLAGGVGAARMLRGISAVMDPARITAIVNTADDTVMHGLRISPDLDTVTYTLAGAIDPDRGWGLVDESWRAMESLARYTPHRPAGSSAGGTWFNLGDRDLATHLYRTARLAEGATLTEVTAEITRAWGLPHSIVPMTDDTVSTRVRVNGAWMGFQEYFVGTHHSVAIEAVDFAGITSARPTAGVTEAIESAAVIVVAPSNPLVSIGPLLALPGIRRLLEARREQVVAVSPIVAGAALKGPADRMLTELGHEPSVVGVARLYASVCATMVIDEQDADRADEIRALGLRCVVTDTIMKTPEVAAALGRTTLEAIS